MAPTNPVPASLKPLEAIGFKIEVVNKNTCTIYAPGGSTATVDINEAKTAAASLAAITKLLQPVVMQARFAKSASEVFLANAKKVGDSIVKLVLPENVKADMLGAFLKRSIEALVPENKG